MTNFDRSIIMKEVEKRIEEQNTGVTDHPKEF